MISREFNIKAIKCYCKGFYLFILPTIRPFLKTNKKSSYK